MHLPDKLFGVVLRDDLVCGHLHDLRGPNDCIAHQFTTQSCQVHVLLRDMENITKIHMPYFLLHVVSNVSIFFLQALELMLVDALLLANDHLKLTSHIEGPSRFWKVCVMNFFTIYVLELRHHKCYSSFLSLVVLF